MHHGFAYLIVSAAVKRPAPWCLGASAAHPQLVHGFTILRSNTARFFGTRVDAWTLFYVARREMRVARPAPRGLTSARSSPRPPANTQDSDNPATSGSR